MRSREASEIANKIARVNLTPHIKPEHHDIVTNYQDYMKKWDEGHKRTEWDLGEPNDMANKTRKRLKEVIQELFTAEGLQHIEKQVPGAVVNGEINMDRLKNILPTDHAYLGGLRLVFGDPDEQEKSYLGILRGPPILKIP